MFHDDPNVIQSLAADASFTDFNCADLAKFADAAAATLDPESFEMLAMEASHRRFQPADFPVLLRAFAKAHVDARLFEDLADEVRTKLSDEMADVAEAFATAWVPAPRLFDAIADQFRDGSSEDLAKLAWAFARLNSDAPKLFDTLADLALRKNFRTQEAAMLLWGFAKAGHFREDLFASFARDLRGPWTSDSIAKISWAYVTAGFSAPELFKKMELTEPLNNVDDIGAIAWAFAMAGIETDFAALSAAAVEKRSELPAQDIALVLEALASANLPIPSDLSAELSSRRFQLLDTGNLNLVDDFDSIFADVPEPSRDDYAEVSAALHRLPWPHTVNHFEGRLCIDLADTVNRRGILVHPPSHFLKLPSGDHRLTGPHNLLTRRLEAIGWNILHLSFFDWHPKSFDDRLALLQSMLSSDSAPPPPPPPRDDENQH